LLWKNLCSQKLRKKRYDKAERRGTIPNRVPSMVGPPSSRPAVG
jgi:hypothetical protein